MLALSYRFEGVWVFITLFAAGCQSMRTAYQNTLARETGFFTCHPSSLFVRFALGECISCAVLAIIRLRVYRKNLIFWTAATIFATSLAIASVSASIASHALSGSLITSAGVTLCYVLALQSIILCSIQMVKSKDVLAPFRYELVLSCKVGMLSALGSIGWFTGFALVNPALVKTLGQIEIVGTLYYSKVRFAEKMTKQQWIGGAMIVISVVLVVTSTIK
ncbi:multidrug transporter [Marinomonas primoryensis]|jgi:drug/metabolite transporter (DMT)-like permease|uniref:multidrug transporter n=1 Tax=Marinomonas primoryensis TaxID=178399 RepID=UPI0037039F47